MCLLVFAITNERIIVCFVQNFFYFLIYEFET